MTWQAAENPGSGEKLTSGVKAHIDDVVDAGAKAPAYPNAELFRRGDRRDALNQGLEP
jgi:hypothetical protein